MIDLPLQSASQDIWAKKYQLKTHSGEAIDETVDDTYKRVAKALADVEPNNKEEWYEKFLWALRNGAVGAGRIMSNVGAQAQKSSTSTINCTVSGTVGDSIEGILQSVKEAGITLSAGCGIGYDFTTLRPKGAYIGGVGATTGGALSFMDVFDAMCFTISSAGGRRGAQMGVLEICHPDIEEFITAKREDGRLRQFNLSILITGDFMKCLKNDGDWQLYFPLNKKESSSLITWKTWPSREDYMRVEGDLVCCKIYKTVKARDLWNSIMKSTYDFAEPGFIMIDEANRMNNNYFCEQIRATNPCGEQFLPPYGSCLLGSINLTKFVRNPFSDQAEFAWDKYRQVVALFTRMLDNVVEINGLPLPEQRHEIEYKRRHGMGYFGLGSAMTMLCMKYGSKESVEFTHDVTKTLAQESWVQSQLLAEEKGCAPIFNDQANRELFVKGKYIERLDSSFLQSLTDNILRHGARFTHATSIAPTGTIALSFGNNCSNGIEPTFAHEYQRNVIREGKKTKEMVTVYSFEALLFHELYPNQPLPSYFSDASTITPKEHVDIQAAAQYWVDASISKTINVPTDIPFEEFEGIYMYAYEKGLKGCTTFRFNPAAFQGVLVTNKDLEGTTYTFVLESGEKVELKGNEEIEYDGETHTAANLYDALKEGYYGKF